MGRFMDANRQNEHRHPSRQPQQQLFDEFGIKKTSPSPHRLFQIFQGINPPGV